MSLSLMMVVHNLLGIVFGDRPMLFFPVLVIKGIFDPLFIHDLEKELVLKILSPSLLPKDTLALYFYPLSLDS